MLYTIYNISPKDPYKCILSCVVHILAALAASSCAENVLQFAEQGLGRPNNDQHTVADHEQSDHGDPQPIGLAMEPQRIGGQ